MGQLISQLIPAPRQKPSTTPSVPTTVDVYRTCPHCRGDLGDRVVVTYRVRAVDQQLYAHSIYYRADVSCNDGGSVECHLCGRMWHCCPLDPTLRRPEWIQECLLNCFTGPSLPVTESDMYYDQEEWEEWMHGSPSFAVEELASHGYSPLTSWFWYKMRPGADKLDAYIVTDRIPTELLDRGTELRIADLPLKLDASDLRSEIGKRRGDDCRKYQFRRRTRRHYPDRL